VAEGPDHLIWKKKKVELTTVYTAIRFTTGSMASIAKKVTFYALAFPILLLQQHGRLLPVPEVKLLIKPKACWVAPCGSGIALCQQLEVGACVGEARMKKAVGNWITN
jgi:hypothetical protein